MSPPTLLILTVLLISARANACFCVKDQPFDEAIELKEEVFLARIDRYSPVQEHLEHGKVYENQVLLTVVEVFKGPSRRQIEASAKIQWVDPSSDLLQTSSCTLISLNTAQVYVVTRNADEDIEFGYCASGVYAASEARIELLRATYGQ